MPAIIYRDPITGQTVPQGGGTGSGGSGPDEVRVQDDQPTDADWELWADMDDDSGVPVSTPTGGLLMYAGATAPAGWLVCDGAAVNRTVYAALFAVIGTTYGIGNGSTTFNLPDLKGRTPVGLDASQAEFNARGKTGGAKTHTLTYQEMPAHSHQYTSDARNIAMFMEGGGTDPAQQGGGKTWDWVGQRTKDTGGNAAHNNLQPYIAMAWIIKV